MIKKIFKNFVNQLASDFKIIRSLKANNIFFLSWSFLIIYYSLTVLLIGFSYGITILLILTFFLTRTSLMGISVAFFISSLIIYLFGARADANHQMSFVFVFLSMAIIKEIIIAINKKND